MPETLSAEIPTSRPFEKGPQMKLWNDRRVSFIAVLFFAPTAGRAKLISYLKLVIALLNRIGPVKNTLASRNWYD